MPKRKKPAAADLPMGDEAAAASSEAPQREVKFKKTRRGGKHWKRKVLRDARWLEQQKLNDAASDKEDEENTEAAKKEGSEEATAWTDAELLDAWSKGETVVLPKGVRIDPRGHPEYEAIVRDLHAALPPKEDKPEQSQQAHYLRRRLRPVPTASDYVNDEDDQEGTFFQQKKSQPSSSSKGPSPSERTAEEYPPLSVDSSSEEPQEKQQNRWDKIPKTVRDPPPLKSTASRSSGTPASASAQHKGQIYSDVKPKENVKVPPPGPKAQLKSRKQREQQEEEAAETTEEERPPIPTPTHLASIDLHRVLDTLGFGSAPPGEEETGDIPDDYLFEVRRLCQLGYRPTIISFVGAANEELREDAHQRVRDFNERLRGTYPELSSVLPLKLTITDNRIHWTTGKGGKHLSLARSYGLRPGIHFDDAIDICNHIPKRLGAEHNVWYAQHRIFRIHGKHNKTKSGESHPSTATVYYNFSAAVSDVVENYPASCWEQ